MEIHQNNAAAGDADSDNDESDDDDVMGVVMRRIGDMASSSSPSVAPGTVIPNDPKSSPASGSNTGQLKYFDSTCSGEIGRLLCT